MSLEDKLLKQIEYEKSYITELFGPDKYFNGPLTSDERKLLEEYIHDKNNPQWKTLIIDGKETNYEISNVGQVKSYHKNRIQILQPRINDDGYLMLKLYINKNKLNISIHGLVALTFHDNPENKPQVNHINGIKDCNWYKNLEWVTNKENVQHAWKNGLCFQPKGEEHANAKYTNNQIHEVCKMLEKGYSFNEIVNVTGVPKYKISNIKSGKGWSHISKLYNLPPMQYKPYFRKEFKEMIFNMFDKNISYDLILEKLNWENNKTNKTTLYNLKDKYNKLKS